MTIPEIRMRLHRIGYALNYTYGVTSNAVVYEWRKTNNEVKQVTINMSDAPLGRNDLEELVLILENSTKVL